MEEQNGAAGIADSAGTPETARTADTVGALGELGVLRRVLGALEPAAAAAVGPGDDSAILVLEGDLAVTSDTMIEGPDFRLAWHSGEELGWKLAATNLSDVAAMGAAPVALTVSLACPRETPVALLEQISRGLSRACAELAPGCGVVGGDLSTAPVLVAAVTAMGDMRGRAPVLRSGARPGDVVAYAGQLGLAGLGLSLLFSEGVDRGGVAHGRALGALRARHPAAIGAQLTPVPPIHSGVLAAEAGATAMLDVSDGLSLDAARIARASGVALSLSPDLLLAGFGAQRAALPGGRDPRHPPERVPLEAMLGGGEDHGFLATFPQGAALPDGFIVIGEVRDRGVGAEAPQLLLGDEGFAPRGWDPYAIPVPRG